MCSQPLLDCEGQTTLWMQFLVVGGILINLFIWKWGPSEPQVPGLSIAALVPFLHHQLEPLAWPSQLIRIPWEGMVGQVFRLSCKPHSLGLSWGTGWPSTELLEHTGLWGDRHESNSYNTKNSKCLWRAYYMPGIFLSTLLMSAQLICTAALRSGCFYNPHFSGEQTEARHDYIMYSTSAYNKRVNEPSLKNPQLLNLHP